MVAFTWRCITIERHGWITLERRHYPAFSGARKESYTMSCGNCVKLTIGISTTKNGFIRNMHFSNNCQNRTRDTNDLYCKTTTFRAIEFHRLGHHLNAEIWSVIISAIYVRPGPFQLSLLLVDGAWLSWDALG